MMALDELKALRAKMEPFGERDDDPATTKDLDSIIALFETSLERIRARSQAALDGHDLIGLVQAHFETMEALGGKKS